MAEDNKTIEVFYDEDELWPHISLALEDDGWHDIGPVDIDAALYQRYKKVCHDFYQLRREVMEALDYD